MAKSSGAPTSRARSVGRLLGSLDQKQFDPGWDTFAVRQQLAREIHRSDRGALKVFARWLRNHPEGRDTGATPDVPFLQLLEDSQAGSPAGEVEAAVGDLSKLVDQGQEGDLD